MRDLPLGSIDLAAFHSATNLQVQCVHDTKNSTACDDGAVTERRPVDADNSPRLAVIAMRRCLCGGIVIVLTLVGLHASVRGTAAAASGSEVDAAIVFVVDMSNSMDADERRILRDSHADAVVSDTVLNAIAEGAFRRVALSYVEFGDLAEVRVGWTIVDSRQSAEQFRKQILAAPMANLGFTGIGGGLEAARVMLAYCPCRPTKRVVDVAADGKNNTHPSLHLARRALLDMGVAINGLPIEIRPWNVDITDYFAKNIVGGPAAFNLPVTGMDQLPERVRKKIVLDLY